MKFAFLWALIISGLLCVQALADPVDGVEYQSESVATADKVSSGLINPAGLGYFNSMGLEYIHNYTDSTYKGDDGALLTSRSFFGAIEWLRHDDNIFRRKYTLAIGDRIFNNFYGGISYSWFGGSNVFYKSRKDWKIGLLYHPRPFASLGLVIDRINQPKFGSFRQYRLYQPGLALRPFGDKFTISADARLNEGRHFNKMQGNIRLAVGPFHALNFVSEYRTEGQWRLGITFDIQQSRVGGQVRLNNPTGFSGGSYFVEVGEMRFSSVAPGMSGRITLDNNIVEEIRQRPILGKGNQSFFSVINCLRRGARDPRIRELVVKMDGISLSFASAQELRDALAEFHNNDKKVTIFISQGGNLDYYVASIADKIYMEPTGLMELKGLAATATFYTGTMEKLGIKAEVLHTGPYKTYGDAFTEKSLTPEAKEQIDWLLDDLYDQFVNGISTGRHLLEDKVKELIDAGPYTAQDAYKAGLIDGLKYYDEISDDEGGWITGSVDLCNFYAIPDYNPRWSDPQKVAVVYADGAIVQGESGRSLIDGRTVGSETLVKSLERLRNDDHIKAVVLRVNSPGGDIFASEEIFRQLQLIKGKKPLIISMGGEAASGGYYISAPGDEIMASPGTITGSIGVVLGKVDLSGLYEKIGLGQVTLKRGAHADIRSSARSATPEEKKLVEKMMWEYYGDFVSKVSASRKIDSDSINAIGQGRVWTGHQALERGLVDRFGGIWDAIDEARQRAGISAKDKLEIAVYPSYGLRLLPNIGVTGIETQIASTIEKAEDINYYFRPPYELKIR
jgi:protease-4